MGLLFFGSDRERNKKVNNRGWVSRLLGCKPQPTAAELAEQAEADRLAERAAVLAKYDMAQRAYMAAVSNRDAREIGRRFMPMQAALHAKIRAGL